MTPANSLSFELYPIRERTDLGQRFLRFAVICLMSISILAPVARFSDSFWLKLDQLLLPVVAVIYLWLLLTGRARPLRSNGLLVVALAFCICILLSMLYGAQILAHPVLLRDFFEIPKALLPALFFTLAYEADLSEQSLRMLATSMLLAVLLICLYAYGQWLNMSFTYYLQPFYTGGLHDEGSLAHYRRVYSTLSNPNFLAMLLTWVIAAFTLGALFRVGSRFWNIALLFASLAALAMTGSRYGLIDTALAVLLVFVLPAPTKESKRRQSGVLLAALPLMLGAILVVSISNPGTFERVQQLRTPLRESSLRIRLDDLWKDATEKFLESPILGHGPAKVIFSDVITDSEYLQILKQYGLVGLLPYLCYFLVPLGMVWEGLRRVPGTGAWLELQWPATYWALCLSFVMIVTSLAMNVGMSTYFNFSLGAFLWMWMGIGASSARRIAEVSRTLPRLLQT